MSNFVIEMIHTIDVAYTNYTGENASDIASRPLLNMFFKAATESYKKESGTGSMNDKAFSVWLFATQFHLPPNVRWIGVRRTPLESSDSATDYEFWLSYSKRVIIPEGTKTKQVSPGLYATLMVNFDKKEMLDPQAIKDSWESLVSSVKQATIEIDSRPYLEEHLQKVNDGGWGGLKVMLPVKMESLPQAIKNGCCFA